MTFIKCPDCGKEVSDTAPSCLNCGRLLSTVASAPQRKRKICIHCGNNQAGKERGLQGSGEVLIFLNLFICGFIPEIIYYIYIYIDSDPFCSGCGRRT